MKEKRLIVDVSAFQRLVLTYFNKYGRNLPWRNTDDEYLIFVSEIMLQQTQVARVLEKYRPFVSRFRDFGKNMRGILRPSSGI
jgi:A/G-specific adenine glycosylase